MVSATYEPQAEADQIVRKRNSMWVRLRLLFKVNTKILIKTLIVLIYPKITQTEINDQPMIKQKKPTPRLQTRSDLKCLKTWKTDSTSILNKYSFMLRICITHHFYFALSISCHFKRFRLNNLLWPRIVCEIFSSV